MSDFVIWETPLWKLDGESMLQKNWPKTWHPFNPCNMNLGLTCIKTVYSWSLSASSEPVSMARHGILSWFPPSHFRIQVFQYIPRYQARQSTCDWKHQHLSYKVVRTNTAKLKSNLLDVRKFPSKNQWDLTHRPCSVDRYSGFLGVHSVDFLGDFLESSKGMNLGNSTPQDFTCHRPCWYKCPLRSKAYQPTYLMKLSDIPQNI